MEIDAKDMMIGALTIAGTAAVVVGAVKCVELVNDINELKSDVTKVNEDLSLIGSSLDYFAHKLERGNDQIEIGNGLIYQAITGEGISLSKKSLLPANRR